MSLAIAFGLELARELGTARAVAASDAFDD
jgi:hypothetical protein